VLDRLSILSIFVVSFYKSDVNIVPQSVMISFGSPCSQNISFINAFANCCAFISLRQGIKWLIFVNRSITTRIGSYASDSGMSVMKSMDIDFHGFPGTSFGCSSPYGACQAVLVLGQVSQFLTYCLIESLMCGQ